MHNRRDFLQTTAVALASDSTAFAADAVPWPGVFTSENQGKWAGKAGSHAPQVTVEGGKVAVVTRHGMSVSHFIVRHTVVLADGIDVGGKTFAAEEKSESSFELPAGYRGKAYATSFCNKHNMWLTEFTV
jgi:superoxide reductase